MDYNMICIIILAIILIIVYVYWDNDTKNKEKERFSTSGMPISDIDCEKMATVYNFSGDKDNINKICGKNRRQNIYYNTGNYYTINGQLL
jgi:uncharacterized protein YpmB